jgi:hypothetical protein
MFQHIQNAQNISSLVPGNLRMTILGGSAAAISRVFDRLNTFIWNWQAKIAATLHHKIYPMRNATR